jgi:ferric enterobactin receptor
MYRTCLLRDAAVGAVVCVLLYPPPASSQAPSTSDPEASTPADVCCSLEGVVRTRDGAPIGGAAVEIVGTSLRTQTTATGTFVLDGLQAGTQVVVRLIVNGRIPEQRVLGITLQREVANFAIDAAVLDHAPATQTLPVVRSQISPVNGDQALPTVREEVVVTASLPTLGATAESGVLTISPDQVAVLPSLGKQDIFRALQLLPGVSSNESASGLFIRGGTPDQNLVDYDGFTVYSVDHLFGVFSAFNMDAVEQIELDKGGLDASRGGRLSGVTELQGRSGADAVGGNIGLSALSLDGLLETPLGRGASVLIAGRRSFQSPLYDKVLNLFNNSATPSGATRGGAGGGRFATFSTEPTSSFSDTNVKLAVPFSPDSRLTVSLFRADDTVDNSRDVQLPEEALARLAARGVVLDTNELSLIDAREWNNSGVSARWDRQWSDRVQSEVTFARSTFDTLLDRQQSTSLNRGTTFEDNRIEDVTVDIAVPVQLTPSHSFTLGFQRTTNDARYAFQNAQGPRGGETGFVGLLDREATGTHTSYYVQDRWMLGNRFIVAPGLRATTFNVADQSVLEPRVSATYLVDERLRLKAAWSRHHQFTTRLVREDVLQGNRPFWTVADGGLVPVSASTQVSGGFAYETAGFVVDVELYDRRLDGLSLLAPRVAGAAQSVDLNEFFYSGTGNAHGLEVLAQKKFGANTGWISYTLARVEQEFPDLGPEAFPADFDRTHELKVVDSIRFGRATASTTWTLSTGTPFTEPIGIEDTTRGFGPGGFSFQEVVTGDKNGARLPAYHRLDLALHWDLPMGQASRKTTMGVTLFNVYDRANVWYKEFSVVDNEIIQTNIGLMGRTLNAFFSVRF